MAPLGPRIAAIIFDSAVVATSSLLFRDLAPSALPNYPLQIQWLAGLSALCSAALLASPGKGRLFALIVLSFKTILFGVIVMSLPIIDLGVLPMIVSFAFLLAAFEEMPVMIALNGSWILIVLVAVNVFPTIRSSGRVAGPEALLLVVCSLFAIGVSLAVRTTYRKNGDQAVLIGELREDIARIVDANIGFQEYSSLVEAHTLRAERDRLSREIHDSAGYALTTMKMAFEAARGIRERDPERLDGILGDGSRLAEEALDEIRRAMRNLRSKPDDLPDGMAFVVRLVRNFESVTKVEVDVDFANSRRTYGRDIDPIIYKMVQEGLINAYRHGHATRVAMTLKEADGELQVRIKDNGASAKKIAKGIGLQGMEERISAVGGAIQFIAGEGGFSIAASIPLARGAAAASGG